MKEDMTAMNNILFQQKIRFELSCFTEHIFRKDDERRVLEVTKVKK